MSSQTIAQTAWNIVFALVCVAALARGRGPERLTVLVLIIADVISALPFEKGQWRSVEPFLAIVDLSVAAFFVGLALTSSRWWPLWAAGFHLMALIMVVITASDPSIRPYTYYVGEQIWDYLGLLPLLYGALVESRRHVADAGSPQASSSVSAK